MKPESNKPPMMNAQRPPHRVSVVVPCYNAGRVLVRCLDAALAQGEPPHEIIVVDDGSNPPVGAVPPGVRVIRHRVNRGVASARNTGWRAATGERILFLDADVQSSPELLARLAPLLNEKSVAGAGARVREGGGPGAPDAWRRSFWEQTGATGNAGNAWMLPGLCAMYRTDALRGAGGFRACFRTNGEDVDLGVRLRARGWRLACTDEPLATHLRRDTAATLSRMVCRHAYWQARAANPTMAARALFRLARWMAVSTGSSLFRHRSMSMALLSPLLCGAALCAGMLGAVDR